MLQTQQQFIDRLQAYLEAEDIRPGDPDHGPWEAAHHPVPRHLGGRRKVLVPKWAHAAHNVIQSEEVGSPAVFNWEYEAILNGPFVTGWFELLDAFAYWRRERAREAAIALHAQKLKDGRSAHAVKAARTRYEA